MSQKLILYTGLKADLLTVRSVRSNDKIMQFKTVELWRNNIERENIEQPFLRPACFIEFMTSNYMELGKKLQQCDMTVRLHIVFESYKDEDADVLALVDSTWKKIQGGQYGFFGVLKRREETQNFDHDNMQDYIQDYDAGKCKDYIDEDLVPTEINTLTITPTA